MTMKMKMLACILGLGLLSAPMQAAAVVNADVTWDIDFKGFLILNYYSEQHLVVNAMEALVDEGSGGTWTMTWGNSASGGNGLTNDTLKDATSIPSNVTVTLPNAWALRGLTTNGTAKVSIAFKEGTTTQELTNGASKVTAQHLKVSQGSVTDQAITIPVTGLLKSQAKIGNVLMDLDISGLTQAGVHTGGKFTITAEAI
ncbi:MAG: hypothetical protein Q4G66_01175 [bacterium]|nr:hypothetical protein [bacterium]